jgi:hypothetical protein
LSEWPEPVREPGETPRWLGWTVAALLFGALLWAVREDAPAREWRLPEFAMPQIDLPEIQWPDFAASGQDADAPVAPVTSADHIGDAAPVVPGPTTAEFNMPAIEGVSFEACVGAIEQAADALGPAMVIESSNDRRVVRFKTAQGDLTMTCSRADGTMRMEQG